MGAPSHRFKTTFAFMLAAVLVGPWFAQPAMARGPEGIADVAEQVIDAVINISTKQTVDLSNDKMPQLPP